MNQSQEKNQDSEELNAGSNKNKISPKKLLLILIIVMLLIAGVFYGVFAFIRSNLNFAPDTSKTTQYQNRRSYSTAPNDIGKFINNTTSDDDDEETTTEDEADQDDSPQSTPTIITEPFNEELRQKRLLSGVQNYNARNNTSTQTIASRQAKLLENIDYTLVKGTKIPCVMENNIISEQAGFTSCIISQDVYSGNARLLLIEKGTRVTGEYRGDVRNGNRRLQIIWDRLITPFDIVIQLDSPTTDRLGASGTTGEVDNRWGTRIGSALLISMMSDALEILGDKNDNAEVIVDSSTSDTSQDIARRILEKNIDLSPIIYIKEAEIINIYVADDIDLSSIYEARRNK